MKTVTPPFHKIPVSISLSRVGGEGRLKKLMFITRRDKQKLDLYIVNNRYRNIKDNVLFANSLGYLTSRTAMHRYMKKLKGVENGRKNF